MSNLSDVIGRKHLRFEHWPNGSNFNYVNDRFGMPNQAIYLNRSFLQAPPGQYFTANFTVTAWINIQSEKLWTIIIDFGNGTRWNNYIFEFSEKLDKLAFSSYNQNVSFTNFSTEKYGVELRQWYHVAYVLQDNEGFMYINGYEVGSSKMHSNKNITTVNNFIGKSWYDQDEYADAIFDDLKIYKGALSSQLIKNEYFQTRPGLL